MKSWTDPGPDLIHTFWLKKLIALHEHLAAQTDQLLVDGTHPEGLTHVVMKDPRRT